MPTRSRWRPRILLASLLIVGGVAVYLVIRIGLAQERKEFVGKVDSVAGYRCRFTLSSLWKHSADESRPHTSVGNEFEAFHLTVSPTQKWIDDHLLHLPATDPPMLAFMTMDTHPDKIRGRFHIVSGYPEMAPTGSLGIVAEHHLQVNGYPATVLKLKQAVPTAADFESILLVYVPDRSLLYAVLGAGKASNFARVDSEVQTITASFHIEKVTPIGGKR